MSGILKKYGKHLASFAILAMLVLPLAAGAASNLDTIVNKQLDNSDIRDTFGEASGESLAQMIGRGINVILGVLGLILVILIIYAGFIWTMARGEAKDVEKAKNMIKNAVVGLIIVFAAYAIAAFVLDNLATISSGT